MRRTVLAVVAVACLALALAAPAGAESQRQSDAATAAKARAAEHQRIVDYWTPQRRASAIPRDIVVPLGTRPDTRAKGGNPGKPGGGGGGGGSGDVLGAAWTAGGSVSVTTGKVFFTLNGTRYVCSGSAVDSTSDSLVLTAGHCVHGGGSSGRYATNFAFYPRYKNGADSTLGAWTATKLVATTRWTTVSNAFEDDAAFAKVGNGTTTTLADALVAAGGTIPVISYTTPATNSKVHAFGYPAAGKYVGTTLIYCSGPVTIGYDGRQTQSIPCDMTGGSSGGPWYQNFGNNGANGVLNSVNSYGYSSVKNRMFGPIFDSTQEGAAFTAANS